MGRGERRAAYLITPLLFEWHAGRYFLERVIPVAETYKIQMACELQPAPQLTTVLTVL
jgi:hypothetical protein